MNHIKFFSVYNFFQNAKIAKFNPCKMYGVYIQYFLKMSARLIVHVHVYAVGANHYEINRLS